MMMMIFIAEGRWLGSATPLFSIVLVPVPFLCILWPTIPSSLWYHLSSPSWTTSSFLTTDPAMKDRRAQCPLSPCAQKTAISVLECPWKVAFFSDFFQNGLFCSVIFPSDPQHASIWCHFKGANPFPVIGLQGPCLAPICSHCPYQQSHQTSFQIWTGSQNYKSRSRDPFPIPFI